MQTALTIWTNISWATSGADSETFGASLGENRLVTGDAALNEADIIFGNPPVPALLAVPKLRWIQITSAGYTPYDKPEVWSHLQAKNIAFTNGSSVFDEACAEHLLAMMLGLVRQLPACVERQTSTLAGGGGEKWSHGFRSRMQVLKGQSAILYGYGAIAKRLAELLLPFRMQVVGVRRRPRGDEQIRIVTTEQAEELLPAFTHVVNILPDNRSTAEFFNTDRFGKMQKGALFYNIGRGTTVNQPALIGALESNHLGGAYLDVTTPEPLPPNDPLWSAPNCHITPHIGGGYHDEHARVLRHFTDNLHRFERNEPLMDRVV